MVSTRSQARRYDMPNRRAAAVIEPVAAIASRRSIFPGPTAISSPRVMRNRNCARAFTISRRLLPLGFVLRRIDACQPRDKDRDEQGADDLLQHHQRAHLASRGNDVAGTIAGEAPEAHVEQVEKGLGASPARA